jgi:hypothetical protein
MKKILIIPLLAISIIINAATYYVAPTTATPAGNDANAGTLAAPWRTWYKAIQTASAGDTVFFRGGVYPMYPTNGQGIVYNPSSGYGHDGTRVDPIVYINYPSETPILDLSNTVPSVTFLFAIRLIGVDNVKFIGLEFRNLKQTSGSNPEHVVEGIRMETHCNNITWERCTVHDFGGIGWLSQENDTISYINCDAYNCVDSLGHLPGNYGSGFSSMNRTIYTARISYRGCRAWRCSDQGFGTQGGRSLVTIDSCWSFSNGAMPTGGGHGYKLGYMGDTSTAHGVDVIMTNSIATFNRENGITDNANGHPRQNMYLYNNIAYHNGYDPTYTLNRRGFNFYANSTGAGVATMRNNISYHNYAGDVFSSTMVHSHNSWDASVTVTDADFVSVDTTGLAGARQADGSLPDINFLKLASTSDLINAGIYVGISYLGSAPDLGPYEYIEEAPPALPQISTYTPYGITINRVITGGYMISDGGGTVSAKGICWGTDTYPDLTDNVTSGGTGVSSFVVTISGLLPNTTYHVRAYVTTENGTAYGADESFVTSQSSIIKHARKIVKR